MCQLLCVHSGNKEINQILLAVGLVVDSASNVHGTGFFHVNKADGEVALYKTKMAADTLVDLGIDIAAWADSNSPLMGHVRAASKGVPVTDENAHPFRGDRFILAHNGRLYQKDEIVSYSSTDNTSVGSDSEAFLAALEAYAKAHPTKPFLELISAVMAEHKGKFALMIFDTKTKDWYICRGKTAELHIASIIEYPMTGGKGTTIGFIVNTTMSSLRDILSVGLPAAQLASGLRISASDITELKKDTVYKIKGKSLIELGTMPETSSYTAPAVSTYTRPSTSSYQNPNLDIEIWKICDRIFNYMVGNFLTIQDIDTLMEVFFGVPMASASIVDLRLFVSNVIPVLSAAKATRLKLNKENLSSFCIYPYLYTQVPALEYPWMLSSPEAINQLVKFLNDKTKG